MKTSNLRLLFILCFQVIFAKNLFAQLGVNDTNSPPAANSILDVKSATKGMYIPRVTTTARNSLSGEGMMVFDTDTKSFWFHNGTNWVALPTIVGVAPINVPEIVNWRGVYNSGTSYATNDLVSSSTVGIYYYSKQNSNTNNLPETQPNFWQAVNFYQLKQIYKQLPLSFDPQTTALFTFSDPTYFFRGKIIYTHNSVSTGNGMASYSAETDLNLIRSVASSGSNTFTDPSSKFGLGQNGLSNGTVNFFFSSHTINLSTDVSAISGTPTITSNGIYFRLIPLGGQTDGASNPTTIVLVP